MRKSIITVLLVFLSFAAFAGSSNTKTTPIDKAPKDSLITNSSTVAGDSIDIRQMVLAQIEAARNKQTQDSIAALEAKNTQSIPAEPVKAVVVSQAVVKVTPKKEKTQWETYMSYIQPVFQAIRMPDEMTIKISIIGAASFFAFLVVYIRRKKLSVNKTTKRNFKDGIKLIREEKVKDKKDSKLSQIRNKLIGTTSAFQLSSDSVSKNARELNISKGEIYLAARIKSHELKKVSY